MTGDADAAGRRAVCAGCGCLCDDLRLAEPPFERGGPNVETDCHRGQRWFARRVFGEALTPRRPSVGGEPSDLPDAAARAAEILAGATYPRVDGLGRLPLGAQRKLVELADRSGAEIGAGASDGELGPVLAVHRDGGPFVTLGEIRDRADCLVLWFVEPERTHPRLLERFYPDTREPSGGGPDERRLVTVGPGAGEGPADTGVDVPADRAVELLWLLRLLVEDPGAPERGRHPLGEEAARLLERLRAAACGAWVFGASGPGAEPDAVEVSGILRLLARLNEEAPWGARPLRGEGNPAGGEAVLTWQSGYPAAVSYRTGRPAYTADARAAGPTASPRHDAILLAGGHPSSLPRNGREASAACVWLDTGAGRRSLAEAGDGPAHDPAGVDAAEAPGAGGDAAAGGGGTAASSGRTEGDDDPPGVAVRIPVLPPGAAAGDTLLRMDGLPVRSPGIPGADEWDGTRAGDALDAVLREIEELQRREAR